MATDILERLATEAIHLTADALEVEYKDGFEEVCVMRGSLGFSIAHFRSSSKDANALVQACYQLAQRGSRRQISVDGSSYDLRCTRYDSFGEDAYHVELRPSSRVKPTPTQGAARRARRPKV